MALVLQNFCPSQMPSFAKNAHCVSKTQRRVLVAPINVIWGVGVRWGSSILENSTS